MHTYCLLSSQNRLKIKDGFLTKDSNYLKILISSKISLILVSLDEYVDEHYASLIILFSNQKHGRARCFRKLGYISIRDLYTYCLLSDHGSLPYPLFTLIVHHDVAGKDLKVPTQSRPPSYAIRGIGIVGVCIGSRYRGDYLAGRPPAYL